MEKTSRGINWVLFTVALLLGFLGLDKIYAAHGFKEGWKFALVKLGFNLIFVGVIWDVWDVVMVLLCKYQLDAREYFA